MYSGKLSDMTGGWFIGNFSPSICLTNVVEVAVKSYKKGDSEDAHFHRIATEITVIISGRVKMFGREWIQGDIIVVEPGDTTAFIAIEDSVNVVVKLPGINNDKYLVEES